MDEKNFFEEFIKKFNQEMNEMGHANLIITGKTGVGKSTLINAAFREDIAKTGIGTPITDTGDVRWYEKKDFPLRIYDTIGLELDGLILSLDKEKDDFGCGKIFGRR